MNGVAASDTFRSDRAFFLSKKVYEKQVDGRGVTFSLLTSTKITPVSWGSGKVWDALMGDARMGEINEAIGIFDVS